MRSRAAVARRAHNPKVTGSIPVFATSLGSTKVESFLIIKFFFMYVVYALYSKKFDKIYIGFTSNLMERFKSHNELSKKGWTVSFRPWKIIFQQEHILKSDAMKREKQLKSASGRDFIRSLIK